MITAFFVVLMFPRKQDFYSLAPHASASVSLVPITIINLLFLFKKQKLQLFQAYSLFSAQL